MGGRRQAPGQGQEVLGPVHQWNLAAPGVQPLPPLQVDLHLPDPALSVCLAMKGLAREAVERVSVPGPVAAASLLDEPHVILLWERLGSAWEQNQGFLGVIDGH